MPSVGLETIVARGADHVEAQMGSQTVMMSVSRGKYFALDGTGQRIWECLAEPAAVGDIIEHLVREYDVERDRCAAEVVSFIAELMDNGLTVEHRP